MCSRCLSLLIVALPLIGAGPQTFRVCADPNNLPFSNERGEGFDNRIADLMARSLGSKLEFVWWSGQKSLIRNTLDEGRCDALMGVPAGIPDAAVTEPYYRSTYVFVSRKDRALHVASLNDSRMEKWRIGIHVVGDDYAPPAFALARRGLSANVAGYSLFGAYGEPNPPARLMDAVADGKVDLAIVWGPLAGYFEKREGSPLEITPVSPPAYLSVPFVYNISMAVRKGNEALRTKLDEAIANNCAGVQSILRDYGVPQVPNGEGNSSCDALRGSRSAYSH